MDPAADPTPPAAPPAPALAKGEPDGGVATHLAGPPEPPPRSRRRWAVLRVLLATLALGWCTQYAMRRHFAVGPYTGPVYLFRGEDGGVGLMDDTGRILIPGVWGYMNLPDPFDGLIMVEERVKIWVVDLWGRKVEREEFIVRYVLDTEGRVIRRGPRPLWVRAAEIEALENAYVGVDDRCGLVFASVSMQVDGKSLRGKQLFSRTGQVVQALDFEMTEGTPILVCTYDDPDMDKGSDERSARLMLLQDDRWIELIKEPGLYIQDVYEYGGMLTGIRCHVRTGGTHPHQGSVGVDLRWNVPNDWQVVREIIANRPGSQVGDPPVLTGVEPLDGAWLALPGSANRLVLAKGLWGLQSPAGVWLCEPLWRAFNYDTEQFVEVSDAAGGVGLMDMDGHLLVPPIYGDVDVYRLARDGFAGYGVRIKTRVSAPAGGLELGDGNPEPEDLPATYAPADAKLDNGASSVDTYGILGIDGEWILPPIYRSLGGPVVWWKTAEAPGRVWAMDATTGRWGLMAGDGTVLLPCDYKDIRDIAPDLWYVELVPDSNSRSGGSARSVGETLDDWTKWTPTSRIVRRVEGRLTTVDLDCESFLPIPDVGFLIIREAKMGLVDLDGREILPVEYPCLRPAGGGAFLLACTPQIADRMEASDMRHVLRAAVEDPWTSRAELLRTLNTEQEAVFGDVEVVYGDYRVYDTAAWTWLPSPLESVIDERGTRYARLDEARGWGLLQPDMQTVLDAQALQLPRPLREISRLINDNGARSASPYRPNGVAAGTPLYCGETAQGTGIFTLDGRVFAPFICRYIELVDARFIRFTVGDQDVLMDRAGRLIGPGGETTWAALGAPGFVPGLRGSQTAAGAVLQ